MTRNPESRHTTDPLPGTDGHGTIATAVKAWKHAQTRTIDADGCGRRP